MMTDEELAAASARLERLLDDLRELVAGPAWQRIQDAMRSVVEIYGAGLGRALAHARWAGASSEALDASLADDELLASLLVLHGLHPHSTDERVRRALAAVATELGDGALELVEIRDGVAHIAVRSQLARGAMAPSLAESIVRRAIESAAPELASVAIAGLAQQPDPTLVQLRRHRPAP